MNELVVTMELMANQLNELVQGPLAIPCELAHYTIVISGVKKSWGSHADVQPFATWLFSLACCFGGGTLVNFLCGKLVLASLVNTQAIFFVTMVWWLIFYAPASSFSKLTQFRPVLLFLLLLKEILRTRKIMKGVKIARSVYPTSFFLCTFMGMLMACGGGFVKVIGLTLGSTWSKNSIKNVYLSPVTKSCLWFSLLYNLQIDGYLLMSMNSIALLQATFIYGLMVSTNFGFSSDPFQPLESAIVSLCISYSAFKGNSESPEKAQTNVKTQAKKHRKSD